MRDLLNLGPSTCMGGALPLSYSAGKAGCQLGQIKLKINVAISRSNQLVLAEEEVAPPRNLIA